MDDSFLKTITILVALSGWFKVVYDHISSSPKISGRLLVVLRGQTESPPGNLLSMFIVYPYLLNKRKNSVHMLDYRLSIRKKGSWKWLELTRAYGMEKVPSFQLSAAAGGEIKLNNYSSNLIYMKKSPAQYGVPLHGWIPFVGAPDRFEWPDLQYKLECIDGYGKKHVIKGKEKDFVSLMLVMEIADVQLPPSMINNQLK
jgi:hypothetical protein